MQPVLAHSGLVVMVSALASDTLSFLGTGVVCSAEGHILTCAHILDLTAQLHIVVPPPIDSFASLTAAGKVQAVPVMVVQIDAENDIALLKPREDLAARIAPNFFGNDELVRVGEEVGCLGVPFGNKGLHTLKLTRTIVCGKSVMVTGSQRLHMDANLHEGNSGGPVIGSRSGQVIGIVSGRFSPVGTGGGVFIGDMPLGADSTISFAIPIKYGVALMREEGLNV